MSSKAYNNSSDRMSNSSEEKRANLLLKKYKRIIDKKRTLEKELKLVEDSKSFSNLFNILEELLYLDPFNKNYLEKYIDLLTISNYEVLAAKFKNILNNFDSDISSNTTENNFNEKNDNYQLYQRIESLLKEKKFLEARNLIIDNLFENSNDEFLNYLQAKTYYYMGDLLKAQVILEDLLTTNPDFIIAKNDLSVIYYQNGLVDKAIDILKNTIDSGAYNLDILKNLANIYKEIEKFEEAINIYHLIIQKYPDDTEALLSMSKLSFEAGYVDDAFLYASKAYEIDRDNPEINKFLKDIENHKNFTEKKKSINKELSENKKNENLVSIVIVTYNNLFYTRETIKSVIKYSDVPFEIIVIDNASTDGSQNYLKNNPNLKVILNDKNIGFAAACNQGISIAKGNYILLLNNDVIVTNSWLSRMLAYMDMDQSIGIVAPITNYISGLQLDNDFLSLKVTEEDIINNGDDIIQQYSEYLFNKNRQKGLLCPRVTAFCMLIKSDLIKRIGGFDERFYIGNYEDDDFCVRARIVGFKIVIASDVFIYHFGSKSFQLLGKEKYIELLQENKKKFIEKYGMLPEEIYKKEDLSQFNKIEEKINILQYDISSVIHSSNTISLCMITKNEEKNLQKCLNSVVDFVNEIIVVDTGSDDSTIEIAKRNKAKVINTKWNNNFSESRNFALTNATSKWILVLDADETLEFDSSLELLDLINKNDFDALTVKIHSFTDDSLCKYEIIPLTRVFKNNESYRYEGIIHEQIKNSILRNSGKIKESNIKILHSGYKTPNNFKIKRNIELLKKALEFDPNNYYYIYQLGLTLFSQDNNDESINYLLKAYEYSKNNPDFFGKYSFEKLLLKISQYYLQHNEIEKAEEFNNILLSKNDKNYVSKYVKAAILFEKKEFQKSLEILNELKNCLIENKIDELDIHQIYIDLGNNYYILEDYESAFNCFQKALEINNNSYIACYNIAHLLFKIGHYEDAKTMFEWSLKLNPSLVKAKEMINKIIELLTKKNE